MLSKYFFSESESSRFISRAGNMWHLYSPPQPPNSWINVAVGMSLTSWSQSPRNLVCGSQLPSSQSHCIFGISGLSYGPLAHRDLTPPSGQGPSSLYRITEDRHLLALKEGEGAPLTLVPWWVTQILSSNGLFWLGIKKCKVSLFVFNPVFLQKKHPPASEP